MKHSPADVVDASGGDQDRKRGRRDSVINTDESQSKRPRSDDSSDTDTEMEATLIGLRKPWKKDSSYYMEDGSCIILIEDTLFNVHRSILSKDGSSFGSMFTLPQGNQEAEGLTDDSPIVLPGDTVSEFRHFLWALYALPPELSIATSPNADLTRLIDIARLSNKYAFKTLEAWALNAIHEQVNPKTPTLLSAKTGTTFHALISAEPTPATKIQNVDQLTKLVRLAQMCNHEPLLNSMVNILKQLMSSSLEYAYLAMSLADELHLRALRGIAYLEVMQKTVVVDCQKPSVLPKPSFPSSSEQPASRTEIQADTRYTLNRAQKMRLLAGYYRLTATWESLRTTPPHFDHALSCGATWHQHGCTQSWLEFWKEKTRTDAVLSLGLADVLGRLRQVQKDYDRWGSATYMHHDCRMVARKSIMEVIKTVEDALPDYFSDDTD